MRMEREQERFAHKPEAPGEIRALMVYDQAPAGLTVLLVVDDRNAPHLQAGEFAVFDPADCDPQHGELFVVRYRSGPVIMQTIRRGSGGKSAWWCVQLDRPIGAAEVVSWAVEGHVIPESDGPYAPGGLESLILGRVVGVLAPAETEAAHG